MLKATGNRAAVGLSYRPTGDASVEQLSLDPEQSQTLRLPAGIAPELKLTSVPAGQYCELSVERQFQVMARDEVVQIDCGDRFLLPESLTAYPLQWVVLPGASLASIQETLRVELIQGDSSSDVPFTIEEGVLRFMMPDATAGVGQIQLWQGDTEIAQIPLTLLATPDLDTDTFLDGWFAEQFVGVEDALSPSELALWQARYDEDSAELRRLYEELSDEDKAAVARYLWVNMTALNNLLETPEVYGKDGVLHLQKASVLSCAASVIKLASFTAGVGYAGLGVVAVGSAAGGPVAIVASGLIVSALAIKSTDKARELATNTVAACAIYRSEPSLLDQILAEKPMQGATAKTLQPFNINLQKDSSEVVITRKFDLLHEQPYQTALRVRRELPETVVRNLRSLQSTLQPISGLVGDRLDWLYLFDFDERIPVSRINTINVSGDNIRANTLTLGELSILSVELAFDDQPFPDRPVRFAITGDAEVHDTWLDNTVPVELNLTGHLSGKKPLAFDVTLNFRPEETLEFTLPTEFATTTSIVTAPLHGRVLPGNELGEYRYIPDEDNEEQISFVYEAKNSMGTAQGTITLIPLKACVYEFLANSKTWRCNYEFPTEEGVLKVTVDIKDDVTGLGGHCMEDMRSIHAYYEKSSANSGVWASATRERVTCEDRIVELTNRVNPLRGYDSLSYWTNLNGGLISANYIIQAYNDPGTLEAPVLDTKCHFLVDNTPYSEINHFPLIDGVRHGPLFTSSHSLTYCPRVSASDIAPFSADFPVTAESVFRYAEQILEMEGIKIQ